MATGSLTIVGCGLHPGHITLETQSHIHNADIVLSCVPTPLCLHALQQLNPRIENLLQFYDGRPRPKTYQAMTARMVECVQEGLEVCAVFYGHPGVFVNSAHAALRQLRALGYQARMLPGISAEACLIADLSVDPAEHGWQGYEATAFLLTQQQVNTQAALIIWQIGLVGELTLKHFLPGARGVTAFVCLMSQWYPESHPVCIYEATLLPGFEPRMQWCELKELANLPLKEYSTLYVPPLTRATLVDGRLQSLGETESALQAFEDIETAPLVPV